MSGSGGLFGLRYVKGSERKKALADPGPSWKEWAYGQFLKAWIGLGLLITDTLVFASITAYHSEDAYVALLGAVPAVLYLNFVLWMYLWHVPTDEDLRARPFHPSPLRPFRIGRWDSDYAKWKAGQLATDRKEIPPEEFV